MKPTKELLKPTNSNQNGRFFEEHKEKQSFSNKSNETHLKKAKELLYNLFGEAFEKVKFTRIEIINKALAKERAIGRKEGEEKGYKRAQIEDFRSCVKYNMKYQGVNEKEMKK
jgi:ribosomal protein L20A (L18A)